MMKYGNEWLMNVPISARERIKAREHLTEKYDSTNIKNEEKPQSKPSYESYSYTPKTTQSALGKVADIAVFGFPLGVFR
ncbi:hypothetical protein FDI95_gp021 [Citrobacter phage CF1 ERZ-2017]|uniref:Uncharacterized protein n=1 Tax=Citrobacter phage CF1 ERZ-2017 TaxID=2267236 RepID=A0A2H4YFW3_9CAUD|nr:hypothetical protein FDI95_gp021 [Citrobacter phage CF1 ERZ-2017]AUE22894.1 hypothetical protein Cf1_00021 [Citrobacter phage CF1 ERZ-2017]